jgi:hypothetical protein
MPVPLPLWGNPSPDQSLFSTRYAAGGFAAAPLHPWLQSAAPSGRALSNLIAA